MQTTLSLAVVIATVGLWATARQPEYLTALMFFAAASIFKLAAPEVIFSGFSSAAFWLVLSGYVLGAAIKKVGLADRIASTAEPYLVGSWWRMVIGVVLLTYGLAFVMPSNMGRITLLMPIVMALADRVGLEPGSKGRIGLALAVGFGTYQISASILPANVPNLVMAGSLENAYGLHLHYLPYLLLHGPLMGVGKAIVLVLCIYWLFPATLRLAGPAPARAPLSRDERKLAVVLAVTLAMWLTDSLHGISAAWVGLVAACVCLLPRVGFIASEDFSRSIDFRAGIYVAGILGLAALVSHSEVGAMLNRAVLAVLPLSPTEVPKSFASLIAAATTLNFVVTSNGVPALYTPLAQSLADASGIPLLTVLMVQVIAYSTPILPYQAAPIVVAIAQGRVPLRDGTRLCLAVAVLTFGILAPLDYVWFKALGYLP